MGIATAQLVGNLTSDPRSNSAGTICNLRVAVNDRRKVGDEWQEVAGFYDVVVLGKSAENCMKYLAKGRQVAIAGKLQWREWEKDGVKRQQVEILANEVQFIGGKQDSEQTPPAKSDTEPDW